MHFDQVWKKDNESLAHVQKPEMGSFSLWIVTTGNRCIWGNNSFNITYGFWSYRIFIQPSPYISAKCSILTLTRIFNSEFSEIFRFSSRGCMWKCLPQNHFSWTLLFLLDLLLNRISSFFFTKIKNELKIIKQKIYLEVENVGYFEH